MYINTIHQFKIKDNHTMTISTAQITPCFTNFLFKTETICCDDACHLKKIVRNTRRSCLTTTSQRMSRMKMLVDRFQFKNHVDSWCKTNCNPNNTEALKVNFKIAIEFIKHNNTTNFLPKNKALCSNTLKDTIHITYCQGFY